MNQTHHLTLTATEVRKRFVSWDRGEADREWACLTLLAEHAPGIAPRPLRRETQDGAPVVVMERLPGEPLGDTPLTRAQTSALGSALRRVYDVSLEAVLAAHVPERIFGPTTLAGTVTSWLGAPCDLSECREQVLVAEALDAALTWLSRPSALPDPALTVLGMADRKPANLLWDGTTCRLLDFEDSGLSEAAYELADTVEHIAGRLPGVVDPDALIAAVGSGPDERDRVRAYRPLWAAFWLAMLLPGSSGFPRNPPGTTERQAVHLLALIA